MLKKVFTPDKGYCRYRDRNNCGIISHSVAERWLNFSRSMRCFLLIPTHPLPPPHPPPAIPQIFQIKTLFVSRFITHSSRQIKFTSVDETFSWHSFRLVFLMQPYVSKARPKRTEGCGTVSFKYLFAPVERLPNNEIFRHRGHPKFFPLSVHRQTSVYPQM